MPYTYIDMSIDPKDINSFIRHFFGMRPTRLTQMKFRWWLLNADAQRESEEAMRKLWDEAPVSCTPQTLDDLEAVKARINKARRSAMVRRRLRRLAVAVVLLLIVVGATFYFSRDYFYAQRNGEEFVQVTVPDGTMRSLTLDDSTKVVINAGSTLVYPRKFDSDTRSVFLIGQASFQVSKDAKRPFIVKTQHLQLKVLGTVFDFSDYPDQPTVSTTLMEGSTQVVVNDVSGVPTRRTYRMRPNQALSYDKATGRVTLRNVDAKRRLLWRQGNLIFENSTFPQIIQALQHKFNVRIECEGIEKLDGRYYVKFRPEESLNDILRLLSSLNGNFDYQIDGREVYIQAY